MSNNTVQCSVTQDAVLCAAGLCQTPANSRPLNFTPVPGMVLWCDFHGFRAGEIGPKTRPVVVLSPHRLNRETIYVAPISRERSRVAALDVCLPAGAYPFLDQFSDQWVKTLLVTHVERSRLAAMSVNGVHPTIQPADLDLVLANLASVFVRRVVPQRVAALPKPPFAR